MTKKIYKLTTKLNKYLKNIKKQIDSYESSFEYNVELVELKKQIDDKYKILSDIDKLNKDDERAIIHDIYTLKLKLLNNRDFKRYNKLVKKYNEVIDYINANLFNI